MVNTAKQAGPPLYYPVFLDLRGRRCVVIGGGHVARRKVEGLLEAGAQVTVIAPRVLPMPAGVEVQLRAFTSGDLAGAMLVYAATDDRAANEAVYQEAQARGIWVNVIDDPDICSFIVPAVVRRGAFCLAISTGGASPVLARRLRERLEGIFGPEYGALVELLWRLRQAWEPRALAAGLPGPARKRAWEHVLDLPLLSYLQAHQQAAAEAAALAVLNAALQHTPDAGQEA